MNKAEVYLFAGWCFVMPVTNFVLLPSVPGTIPANFFALLSLGFMVVRLLSGRADERMAGYLKIFGLAVFFWFVLAVGSQLGHVLNDRRDFGDVPNTSEDDTTVIFRKSMFTQSIYLVASILTAIYCRFYFRRSFMKFVYAGAYFMAFYGIYEWLYFLIFKKPGDFLGNRVYGIGGSGDTHTGSWSQAVDFAGVYLLRIKSTFGEPSFFSAAVVPYFFVALDNRKKLLAALLFFDAFFSTSASCYISLALCIVLRSVWVGKNLGPNIGIAAVFALGVFALSQLFPATFDTLFGQKFSGSGESGEAHTYSYIAMLDLLTTFSAFNWLFGLGVGYLYINVTNAVLFNTGLIGLTIYLIMFLKPMFLLESKDSLSLSLKSALLAIFVDYTLNVSEFFLPTTWMFIGLAFWRLDEERKARAYHPPPIGSAPAVEQASASPV